MATHIRRATPADAARLAALAEHTFTEAFGHLYPDRDLRDFIDQSYSVERQRVILSTPGYAVWLLEHEGVAVGHAAAGPCGLPNPGVQAGDGELKRLYVLAAFQGSGWGGRLFQAALDWLLADGPRTLWIGVWSQNLGAQRFYARHGFMKVGEHTFPVGRVVDREFTLRRAMAA
ncbi:MAG: GNAT family N-acetyltransferase [Lysobacteraceae bacterium]|nr:MAG: GNAT family N-acetyltransferase [Xanthomonadaceae bacterium]